MWLVAVVTVVLGCSAALAGAATTGSVTRERVPTADAAGDALAVPAGRDAHIPPPPGKNADYGIHFNPISTRVRKAKVRFSLPPLVFRSYLQVCVTSATFATPCPGHDVSRYPKLPFSYAWDVAFADNWVAVRHGATLDFGKFPPVKVSMLGFGALPVTATAHLTQTATNGVYDPMSLRVAFDISPVPPGKAVPGFGPAPMYRSGTTFFNYRAVSTGTVDIRLSNVTVDQVPLRVGPDCHTAAPAKLALSAPAGYYPQSKGPTQLKGKPGEFQPLSGGGPAGYLQGNVDVPAFTGCHDGGDNLDRLITGMISGPANPVNAYSPAGLQLWCTEAIAHCAGRTTAAQRLMLRVAEGRQPLDASSVAALKRTTAPPPQLPAASP